MRTRALAPLLIVLSLALAGCGFLGESSRTLTVVLPDAAGLFVGNDVGVLGVPIGRVSALRPEGDSVVATLTITDPSIKIPAGVGAAIVSRSVAADRYVELTPVYDGGPTIRDGAVIPRDRTVTPVDFDQALGALRRLTQDLAADPRVAHNLGDLLNVSASTLAGHGGDINAAVRSMSGAMTDVSANRENIVGTIRSLETLTSVIATHESTVRAFIQNGSDAAQMLASERFALAGALTSLSHSIDAVSTFAHSHERALHDDITALTDVLRRTAQSRTDLNAALDTLPLAGQNLLRAVSHGRLRAQQDPATLVPIGGFIQKACDLVPGKCVGLSVPPSTSGILQLLLGGVL